MKFFEATSETCSPTQTLQDEIGPIKIGHKYPIQNNQSSGAHEMPV